MAKEGSIHWQIVEAKRAHRKWVSHAQLLIEGGAVEKEMVPVHETDCGFGRWYFSQEGQSFSANPLFQKIGVQHEQLHGKYIEIYSLLFGEAKPSFFSRLIGTSRKKSEANLELAKMKYQELNTISHEMVSLLDQFIQQIEK